jgi:hypothetical protein
MSSVSYNTRLQTKYRLIITVRIVVLMRADIKIAVFWYVTCCSIFRLYGVTSQKTVILLIILFKKLYEISIFCLN